MLPFMCNSNFPLVPIKLNNFKTPTIYSLSVVTADTACVLFLTLTFEIYFIVYIFCRTLGQFSYVHISEPWQLPTFCIPFNPTFPEFFNWNHLPSVVSLTRLSSEHFIFVYYIAIDFPRYFVYLLWYNIVKYTIYGYRVLFLFTYSKL